MITLLVFAVVATAILLWLNSLASLAIKYDRTLDKTQKIAQMFLVWLVPFFGASFVLHLVSEHYPDAIPRKWVPWPFRGMIFGAPVEPNRNRDDREIDHVGGGRNRTHSARESSDAGEGD